MKKTIYILVHISFAALLYIILLKSGYQNSTSDTTNLLSWDAKWYNQMRLFGYIYVPDETCNLAFFPLFPYFWRLTGLTPTGISVFNCLLYLVAFWTLARHLRLSIQLTFFFVCIPSVIFFAVPYSESIFFTFTTLILIGYSRKNNLVVFLGFLGASVTRSVSVIFIPALIILFFLDNTGSTRKKIVTSASNLCACVVGFFFAALIQFYQTNKWLYFLEIQKYWRREWIIPNLPFTTYSAERMLGIDAIALCLGCLAISRCISWLLNFRLKKLNAGSLSLKPENAVIFSALYLSGTAILDSIFTFNLKNSTNIWSMNRHLLCTPFAVVFLVHLLKEAKTIGWNKIADPIFIIGCIIITSLYLQFNLMLFYFGFFASLYVLKYLPSYRWLVILFYLSSTYIQAKFYSDFLLGRWIG
jgi:hypothetical protein